MFSLKYKKKLFLILACLNLAGCQSFFYSGKHLDSYQLAKVEVGTSNYQDVLNYFGSPSLEQDYNRRIYYIHVSMSKTAWFKPKIYNQQMVRVSFNDDGVVNSILVDKDSLPSENVYSSPSKEITPIYSTYSTPLRHWINNTGKFSKKKYKRKKD